MACKFCNHQGFIASYVFRDNGSKGIVKQCPECRDIKAYSEEILRRVGHVIPKQEGVTVHGSRPMGVLLPFRAKQ